MLLYAYPSFAAVFASWIYRESISRPAWFCMAAALVGVIVLADPSGGADATGILCGLLSAVCAGLTTTVIQRLKQTRARS